MKSQQNQKFIFKNSNQRMKNFKEGWKKLKLFLNKRMKIWKMLKIWEKKRMLLKHNRSHSWTCNYKKQRLLLTNQEILILIFLLLSNRSSQKNPNWIKNLKVKLMRFRINIDKSWEILRKSSRLKDNDFKKNLNKLFKHQALLKQNLRYEYRNKKTK